MEFLTRGDSGLRRKSRSTSIQTGLGADAPKRAVADVSAISLTVEAGSREEFYMHSVLRRSAIALAMAAAPFVTGCASVESVEMAQATANQALSTAQSATSAAQAAQQRADQANQQAQNAFAAAQSAQSSATE